MSNNAVGHDKGKQVLFAETQKKPWAQKWWYMKWFNAYVTKPVDITYTTKEEILKTIDPSANLLKFNDPDKDIFLYNTEFFDNMEHGEVFKNMRDFVEKEYSSEYSQFFLESFMHAISQIALKMELLRHKMEKELVQQNHLYPLENLDMFFEAARIEEFSLTLDRKLKDLKINQLADLLCDKFPSLPDAIKEAIYLTFHHIQWIDFWLVGLMPINQN
jgi:hypothetical protein